jgi:hypothetical protein
VVEPALLSAIEGDILKPSVVERAVGLALDALEADRPEARRMGLERDLARTEAKLGRLVGAGEEGGPLSTLVAAIQTSEGERDRLRTELRAFEGAPGEMPRDRRTLERRLREYLLDCKGLLQRHVAEARQMLEALLADRLVFTPTTDTGGAACYGCRAGSRLGAFSAESSVHKVWRPRQVSNLRPPV